MKKTIVMPCEQLGWTRPETPTGWYPETRLGDGQRYRNRSRKLCAIISIAIQDDGKRWVHLSLSHNDRIPTWGELRTTKDAFLGADVYAYQVLPPRSRYVNYNARVLHLFHCLDGNPVPEFSIELPDGSRIV